VIRRRAGPAAAETEIVSCPAMKRGRNTVDCAEVNRLVQLPGEIGWQLGDRLIL
jgi:hypothetical protein